MMELMLSALGGLIGLLGLATSTVVAPSSNENVTGTVYYASDTPIAANLHYTSGGIVAIEDALWPSLLQSVREQENIHDDHPRNIQTGLRHNLYDRYVIAHGAINTQGHYALTLGKGSYTLCAVDLSSKPMAPFQYRVILNGCIEHIQVQQQPQKIDFEFGEFGFVLQGKP